MPVSSLTRTSEPLETIAAFVDAFVTAWPAGDASPLGDYFTENAVYHNGPLEPVTGRAAIVATLGSFMTLGGRVSVDLVHTLAVDTLVMTERVDYLVTGGRSIALPVVGVFEMDGGRIAAWRDYFDLSQFTSQLEGDA